MFNTPILYIIFNRLDTVKQTFPRIKAQQPAQLFIAADGPRVNKLGEKEKCAEVREWVLSQIDWNCNVKTLFREENLGCGKGPAEAITWFFNNVEQGIILEDDCLTNNSFFPFCEELLNKYKKDYRVMQISGTNRLDIFQNDESDYLFTIYPSEWGWASWKRAWNLYDFNISKWQSIETQKIIKDIYYKPNWFSGMTGILNTTINNPEVSWWDYQWGFCKNINNALTITPCTNLVSNIGFGDNATHTASKANPFMNLPTHEINFPLIHPSIIYRCIDFDTQILDKHFPKSQKESLLRKTISYRICRKIYHCFFKKKP